MDILCIVHNDYFFDPFVDLPVRDSYETARSYLAQ